MTMTCELCSEIANPTANPLGLNSGDGRRVGVEGQVHAFPTLGPVARGHMLIVPTRHARAVADLPKQELNVAIKMIGIYNGKLAATYRSEVIGFEHGCRGAAAGGCGISHAHFHLVPVLSGARVVERVRQDYPNLVEIPSMQALRGNAWSNTPYILLSAEGQLHAAPAPMLPSQYLRKCVAETIGQPEWNWREHPRVPIARQTYADFVTT